MGRRVIEAAVSSGTIDIVAAWASPSSPRLGQPAHENWPALKYAPPGAHAVKPDVVIDFGLPEAFDALVGWCRANRVALVSGTTGLSAAQRDRLADAANDIAALWTANFSIGIAMLERLVAQSARLLPAWDIEIVEAHHAGKRDAPSGTALALARVAAEARRHSLDEAAKLVRSGNASARAPGEIGFASIRAGDIVGEHTVLLASAGERIELSHRAGDRGIFARGALHAARWLAGRGPGLYAFSATLSDGEA